MPLTEGSKSATEQWEVFALALAAPLGPFSQVRLAPRFPRGQVNTALATYLPLNDDELLLALIDPGGRRAPCRCALTTRRVYWTEKEKEARAELTGGTESKRRNRRAKNSLVVRIAQYGDLPDQIAAIEGLPGSFAIDLGRGTTIELGQVDGKLASTLARYLEKMGHAARAGTALEGLIDPDLAVRAARVLPQVTRVTAEARAFGQDISDFRAALQSATPRAVMTYVMTAACIIVYLAMVAKGVHWLWPTATQLIDWGANQGIGIAVYDEYWRLFTNVFLHGGLIHLGMNIWSLLVIGPLVERLYGNLAFAFIYLVSGVGGAIASLTASPLRVGVGASGAICGVLGALVAFLIVHRRAIPKSILKSFRGSLLSVVVFMAILGYFVPNIDQQAHIGGGVTGILSGLLLSRPWPVVSSRWLVMRRLVAALLLAVALAGVAVAVSRRASAALPPDLRLQLITEEYQAIAIAAPHASILFTDFDNQKARVSQIKKIKALTGRARANLAALRRVKASDSSVQTKTNAVIDAQSRQLAVLQAEQRFLETGDHKAVPPVVRFQAFMEQIGPALEDYEAITTAAPSTLVLRKDIGDPQARAAHQKSARTFIDRALENLTRSGRVKTPDPLLKEMLKSFVEAQSSQLAGLRASERFLETGDPENLNGADGMLEAVTTAKKAVHSFQEQQLRFLRDNGLIPADAGP